MHINNQIIDYSYIQGNGLEFFMCLYIWGEVWGSGSWGHVPLQHGLANELNVNNKYN